MTSAASPSSPSPIEVRTYISDMLSQLADMARGAREPHLELAIRLLAVEAASSEVLRDPLSSKVTNGS